MKLRELKTQAKAATEKHARVTGLYGDSEIQNLAVSANERTFKDRRHGIRPQSHL